MGRVVQGWFYKLRRTHEGNSLARHVTKAWSKRYFVIVRDRINWYKNADPNSGEKPSGFINFQEILRIRVLHAENRLDDQFNRDEYGTYSLEIVANSRRLTIRTPSRDEAMVWTYELRKKLKIWTERTGVETLREVALQRKTVDSRDKLMERIDKALENVSLEETTQTNYRNDRQSRDARITRSVDADTSISSFDSENSIEKRRKKNRREAKNARNTVPASKATREIEDESVGSSSTRGDRERPRRIKSKSKSSSERSSSERSSSERKEKKTASRRRDREKITLASSTDSAVSAVGSDAEDDTPIKPTKRRGKQRSKSRRSSTSPRSHETRQETKAHRQDNTKLTPSWPTRKNEMTKTLLDVPEVEHLDDFEYQPRHGRGRNSQQKSSIHRRTQDEEKLFEVASSRNRGTKSTIPTAVSCNDNDADWLEESL